MGLGLCDCSGADVGHLVCPWLDACGTLCTHSVGAQGSLVPGRLYAVGRMPILCLQYLVALAAGPSVEFWL